MNMESLVNKLKEVKSVALFTHTNPDGDALGSVFAVKSVLEANNIRAELYLEKDMPEKFAYLNSGYRHGAKYSSLSEDCAFALDCGASARLGALEPLFKTAKLTLCLDHHISSANFCDIAYIDPEAAATCELVFSFAKLFSENIPYEAMQGIYTGISTDTGHFKYSNTSAKTLKIAAELVESGLDFRSITTRLYDTTKLEKLKFLGKAAERITLYDGIVSVLFAEEDFLSEYSLSYEDIEELPNLVSNVEGAVVGILVKTADKAGSYKLSFRGHDLIDLSEVAKMFCGGGHKNAAACVIDEPPKSALEKIIKKIHLMLKD